MTPPKRRPLLLPALGVLAAWVVVGALVLLNLERGVAVRGPDTNKVTATCDDAALGEADPRWRKHSVRAGPFGFSGPGRFNFRGLDRRANGTYLAKVPAIVEGSRSVNVAIAPRDIERGGLNFVTPYSNTLEGSFDEVRFLPCARRTRTGWPGGFVLRVPRPVKLFVRVDGWRTWRTIVVGKPKRPRR